MTFSEIQNRAENLPSIIQKLLFVDLLLSEITVMNRAIWDTPAEVEEQLDGLKWSNELVHRIQNIRFELKRQEDDEAMQRIFDQLKSYSEQSDSLKSHLAPCLQSTMFRFDQMKVSWEFETDIDPAQRYIQIWDKIPFKDEVSQLSLSRKKYERLGDDEFSALEQEFESFKRDWSSGRLMSVGIGYAYANVQLPKVYDIVFDTKNRDRFWKIKTIVRYAFNYRDLFHTDLWRGHHSHCMIEIVGDVPDIFDELEFNNEGERTHHGIGLCTEEDWRYIKVTES